MSNCHKIVTLNFQFPKYINGSIFGSPHTLSNGQNFPFKFPISSNSHILTFKTKNRKTSRLKLARERKRNISISHSRSLTFHLQTKYRSPSQNTHILSFIAPMARSVSPTLTRKALDSRNPEIGVRKSFSKPSIISNRRSFDPSTPANSPADLSRRVSASLRASYEHKENEKDLNQKLSRGRSSSVLKGSKNFMAPTISAASKITPSPRKKILTERNEVLRSSVSDSDGNSSVVTDSEVPQEILKPRIGDPEEVVDSSQVPSQTHHNFSESLPENGVSETSPKNFDLGSKIKRCCSSPSIGVVPLDTDPSLPPEIGVSESNFKNVDSNVMMKTCGSSPSNVMPPLDSDPSLPPYDPKTNFLSPRPRFLHYKPKPRIEAYLNKELATGEGKRLEESFTSESCSDTEISGETQTQSPESQKESENASSSSEIVSEEEEEEPHVIEAKPFSTHEEKKEVPVKMEPTSKSHSRVRSKIVLLMLFLLAMAVSVPVIDSPMFPPSGYIEQTFFKPPSSSTIAEFARTNINGITSNIKFWSAQSISFISELISVPKVVEDMGVYDAFTNSTTFHEELIGGEHQNKEEFQQNDLEKGRRVKTEAMPPKEEQEEQSQVEEVELVVNEEFGDETRIEEEFEQNEVEQERVRETELVVPNEEQNEPVQVEEIVVVAKEEFGGGNENLEEKSSLLVTEMNTQPTDVKVTQQNSESNAHQIPDLEELSENVVLGVETLESAVLEQEHNIPVQYVLGILSVLTLLAMTAVYSGLKRRKATTTVVPISVKQLPPKKVESISGDNELLHQERMSSRNWPTEVEMDGESGPSEMSSSFKESLSYRQRDLERANEVQSHERKPRYSKRESLASSSEYSGSPSYGSFTTFEKIHGKHGYGDDEVVTPVRRSSRIRKHVTSP